MRKLIILIFLLVISLVSCTYTQPKPDINYGVVLSKTHYLNEKYEYMDDYFMITSALFMYDEETLYLEVEVDTSFSYFEYAKLELHFPDIPSNYRTIESEYLGFENNKLIYKLCDYHSGVYNNEMINHNKIATLKLMEGYSSTDIISDECDAFLQLQLDKRFLTYDEAYGDWMIHYFKAYFEY